MSKFNKISFFMLLLYLAGGCQSNSIFNKTPRLALLPLGDVSQTEIDEVHKTLSKYYNINIFILKPSALPAHTTNEAVGKVLKTTLPLRYRADSLLRYMDKQKRGDFDYILGISNIDITCTNRDANGQIMFPGWMHADWGIFGLGYLGGKACIISSFRLRLDNPPVARLHERLAKVARHEIGHNFNLRHCPNKCFMSAADLRHALVALDNEADSLCLACQNKLGKLVKKPIEKISQPKTRIMSFLFE